MDGIFCKEACCMLFENTMVMEESDMELASESIPVPQVQERIVDTVKRNKSGASRKPRLRKKALHASILKQMEFYFSNANLSKDRYLSGLLKENPCKYSSLVSSIEVKSLDFMYVHTAFINAQSY